MKRAILLLATALLGVAGCTSHPCDNRDDLIVDWSAFTDASGNTFACTDPRSGVASVQVFIDDVAQFPSPVACIPFPNQSPRPAVTLAAFTPGTYKVEVQAYDANGTLLYDDVANQTIAPTCGGTQFNARMTAVQGPLDLAYTLPVPQCPPNSFVWFSLTALSPGVQSLVIDGLHNPQGFPCGNPYPLPIDAPFGTYRLDFIQVVQASGAVFTAQYENCAPGITVNHVQSDQIPVALSAATTGCQ